MKLFESKYVNESIMGGAIVGFIIGLIVKAYADSTGEFGSVASEIDKIGSAAEKRAPEKKQKIRTNVKIAKDIIDNLPSDFRNNREGLEGIVRKYVEDLDDQSVKGIEIPKGVGKEEQADMVKRLESLINSMGKTPSNDYTPGSLKSTLLKLILNKVRYRELETSVEHFASFLENFIRKTYDLFYKYNGVWGDSKTTLKRGDIVIKNEYDGKWGFDDETRDAGKFDYYPSWKITVDSGKAPDSMEITYSTMVSPLTAAGSSSDAVASDQFSDSFTLTRGNGKEFKDWIMQVSKKGREALTTDYASGETLRRLAGNIDNEKYLL